MRQRLQNSNGFQISLNGAIGEIWKGHWWELLFPYTGRKHHFDARLIAARRFVFEGEVPGLLAFEYTNTLVDHYADVIRETNRGLEDYPNTVLLDHVYLALRQQKWLGRVVSATDRVWPCISPYGFRQPLELALAARPSIKLHHRMSRRLIEYESPVLARIPMAGGYPAMPLRLGTLHHFAPLLKRYSHLVLRRLSINAKLQDSKRIVPKLYPSASWPLPSLLEPEEVRSMLDFRQMCTGALYDRKVLASEIEKGLGERSTRAYRLGRILTLEVLASTIRTQRAAAELAAVEDAIATLSKRVAVA